MDVNNRRRRVEISGGHRFLIAIFGLFTEMAVWGVAFNAGARFIMTAGRDMCVGVRVCV